MVVVMISGGLVMFTYQVILVLLKLITFILYSFFFQATQFNLGGFLMVMFASFLRLVSFCSIFYCMFDEISMCICSIFMVLNSGLRWTLSQMVMQKSEMGLANPIDMMYHIQPWMIVTLLPFAMVFEGIYSYDFIP